MSDLVRLADHEPDRIRWLLGVAAEVGQDPDRFAAALSGRTVALLVRTEGRRVIPTFGAAAARLGAWPLPVPARDLGVDPEGDPRTAGRLLGATVDQVVASLAHQGATARLAAAAGVPVVDGGGADGDPCRALADLLALRGRLLDLAGRKVAWVGAWRPLLSSLTVAAPALGLDLDIAVSGVDSSAVEKDDPTSMAPDPAAADSLAEGRRRAKAAGTLIRAQAEAAAVASADAVYRDGGLTLSAGSEAEPLGDAPERCGVLVAMAVMLWLADAV